MIYSVCKHSFRTGSSGLKHQTGLLQGKREMETGAEAPSRSDHRSQRE